MSRSKDPRQFAKLALDYLQNPKISKLYRAARKQYGLDGQQLADQAVIAHIASIIYSRSSLTDGELFPEDAFMIARTRDREAVDELLLDAGLWVKEGDSRMVHDYSQHQEMKADIERRSSAATTAAHARWNATRNATRNAEERRGEEKRETYAHHADADALVDVPADKPPLAAAPKAKKYPAEFEQFWKVYPVKQGKGAALKAWRKAVKRATNDQLIAGAQRYRDDKKRDPEHTKYAEGWLNDDRWLDEPTTAAPAATDEWWEN